MSEMFKRTDGPAVLTGPKWYERTPEQIEQMRKVREDWAPVMKTPEDAEKWWALTDEERAQIVARAKERLAEIKVQSSSDTEWSCEVCDSERDY